MFIIIIIIINFHHHHNHFYNNLCPRRLCKLTNSSKWQHVSTDWHVYNVLYLPRFTSHLSSVSISHVGLVCSEIKDTHTHTHTSHFSHVGLVCSEIKDTLTHTQVHYGTFGWAHRPKSISFKFCSSSSSRFSYNTQQTQHTPVTDSDDD